MKNKNKDYLFESERIMRAFYQVNLSEEVAPVQNGKIVENVDLYNKVKKLLSTKEMAKAHPFLLNIYDFDNVSFDDEKKINDLFKLASDAGYLTKLELDASSLSAEDEEKDEEEEENNSDTEDKEEEGVDEDDSDSVTVNDKNIEDKETIKENELGVSYTLFYTAMKNGDIHGGECYVTAPNIEEAKLKGISRLEKLGFTAIDIIASEETVKQDIEPRGYDNSLDDTVAYKISDDYADKIEFAAE